MPTLNVWTDVTERSVRNRFSRRVALALGRAGVNMGHTVICWHEMDIESVFCGPVPMPASAESALGKICFMSIEVDQRRERSWRDQISAAIRESATGVFPLDRFFFRIVPVDPADYWNAALSVERASYEGSRP
jgi:hypothetical protein